MKQIVELNAADLARAEACARRRHTLDSEQNVGSSTFNVEWRTDENLLDWHEQGAQGEIVVGKVLGIEAPLYDGLAHRPNLPPNWSVKTQASTAKDMRDRYLRLLPRARGVGWRYVLVERDIAMWGGYVFTVHGWISEEKVREVSVKRYTWSENRFVHLRHLQPLEPLSQLDEDYWAERAACWSFDENGELELADG